MLLVNMSFPRFLRPESAWLETESQKKSRYIPLIISSFLDLTFHSLRRRFQQNQEDCTITVLELLPTMAQNVLEALPSESISKELQQKRSQRLNKSAGPSELSSGTLSAADEDGRSLSSFPSESFVHASQMEASSTGDRESRVTKSKAQLWNELKISCKYLTIQLSKPPTNGAQRLRERSLSFTLRLC